MARTYKVVRKAIADAKLAEIEATSRAEEEEIAEIKTLLFEAKPAEGKNRPWLKDSIAIAIIAALAIITAILLSIMN